ncbi:hypothetical protein LX69_01170 [Breznakibacter xylanolyticus]|uniref:Uncharacterized protein n=1 Tax=Breznakibacter xylanolyticus TaxID=990 RepID=A0A2W7NF68_9BACT|nr:hypothetical protein LX69_01170 [Breznakibacter xylanolyticus]
MVFIEYKTNQINAETRKGAELFCYALRLNNKSHHSKELYSSLTKASDVSLKIQDMFQQDRFRSNSRCLGSSKND